MFIIQSFMALLDRVSLLAFLYGSTGSGCCQPDVGLDVAIALKGFMTSVFLCGGQGAVRRAIL